MSYDYRPKFEAQALAGFRALEPWLQEEVLDEIERLLESTPAPSVSQRLHPSATVHEFSRAAHGIEHLVFLSTLLDVPTRVLLIRRVGLVTRR